MSAGLDLVMKWEGYAKRLDDGSCLAYWDKPGARWTIGYGSTGPDIRSQTHWSHAQAFARLVQQFRACQQACSRLSPGLNGMRLEAVSSFAYNLGVGRYQASTLRRYVDQGRWNEAAEEFLKWRYARGKVIAGLVARRRDERLLFLSPDSTISVPSLPTPGKMAETDQPATLDTLPQVDDTAFQAVAALLAAWFRRP